MFGFKKTDHVGAFITGAPGQSVLQSVSDLADHFKVLDGWEVEMLSVPELTYLAAFTAWVAVRYDRGRFRLVQRDAIEVGFGLIQSLSRWYSKIKSLSPEEMQRLTKLGGERLLEYDAMWTVGMNKSDLGAYLLHAFTCVQADEEKTQDGFLDHVTTFPQTISRLDRRLKGATG